MAKLTYKKLIQDKAEREARFFLASKGLQDYETKDLEIKLTPQENHIAFDVYFEHNKINYRLHGYINYLDCRITLFYENGQILFQNYVEVFKFR